MFGWGAIIAEEASRSAQQSAQADRLLRELDEQIVRGELQRAEASAGAERPGVPRLGEDWTYNGWDARDGELVGAAAPAPPRVRARATPCTQLDAARPPPREQTGGGAAEDEEQWWRAHEGGASAEEAFRAGVAALELGDAEAALRMFTRALQACPPSFPGAFSEIVRAIAAAESVLRSAAGLPPDAPAALPASASFSQLQLLPPSQQPHAGTDAQPDGGPPRAATPSGDPPAALTSPPLTPPPWQEAADALGDASSRLLALPGALAAAAGHVAQPLGDLGQMLRQGWEAPPPPSAAAADEAYKAALLLVDQRRLLEARTALLRARAACPPESEPLARRIERLLSAIGADDGPDYTGGRAAAAGLLALPHALLSASAAQH